MRSRIKAGMRSKKAELYLDTIILVFVIFLLISLFLTVLPAIVQKQQLDVVAKETARFIEIQGSINGYESEIQSIGERVGCVPDRIDPVEIEGGGSGDQIQLRTVFYVSIEKDVVIGGGILPGITITLRSVSNGRSEVYWK